MKRILLIDLDGVLRTGEKPAKYVNEFLEFINEEKIKACILSNSSIYSSKKVLDFFKKYSIKLNNIPVLTTVDASAAFVKRNYSKVAVYASNDVKVLLKDYLDYKNPQAVLVGDIGNTWTYEIMQKIFLFLQNGAKLIAMHKNKYWNKENAGLQLDAGVFIKGLEYAASVKAKLIGKPSKIYFQTALKLLGESNNTKFIMLGDDLETDISGAKKIGAKTILIYTGKTNKPIPNKYKNKIDFEVENLREVIELLKKIKLI